jgi:hypothetical protein
MAVIVSYNVKRHACNFTVPSSMNGQGNRTFKCAMSPTVTWQQLAPFAHAAVDTLKSDASDSIMEKVEILRSMQRFMTSKEIAFPKQDSDWDEYLGDHFEFTLDDLGTTSKRSPETRIKKWIQNARFYQAAQTSGLIPKSAFIPSAHLSDGSRFRTSPRPPLGKLANAVSGASGEWNKQSLVSRDLCLDEDEFLCRISSSLSTAIQATVEGCEEYLTKMKAAHELGRSLIARIDEKDLERRVKTGDVYKDGVHVTDLRNEDALSWILAGANYLLTETDSLHSLNFNTMAKFDFFQKFRGSYYRAKFSEKIRDTIGKLGIHTKNISENFARLLGHFSARDCAAMASILIIDQPKYPSTGLQAATLVNIDGEKLIEVQLDEKTIRFSVEKPRAEKYQSETLTPRSAEIFKYILKCTQKLRIKLDANNNPRSNFLFLTVTRDGIICPGNIDNIMHSNGHTLYQEIEHHFKGLHVDKETFSLGALRVTQGLITYFQTGSLYEVSLRLGNQVQTVKACYIPDWVQERRYIWMIRAFQAKMVLLATVDKPWALTASDFLTQDELKLFVSKQLKKSKRPDAFSQHFRSKFMNDHYSSTILEISKSNMAYEISEQSLTALYSLADYTIKNSNQKDLAKIDPILKISMDAIIQLKGLIVGIAEANLPSDLDQQTASNIYHDSRLELQMFHKKAVANVEKFSAKSSLKQMELSL